MAKYREVHSLSLVDAAYIAGLIDGEGTITLSRKHANDGRQLVISISSTERPILDFARERIGAGKITSKKTAKAHHAPAFTYSIGNRQALNLLLQIQPLLRSYKRQRAALVRDCYLATHTAQRQVHARALGGEEALRRRLPIVAREFRHDTLRRTSGRHASAGPRVASRARPESTRVLLANRPNVPRCSPSLR